MNRVNERPTFHPYCVPSDNQFLIGSWKATMYIISKESQMAHSIKREFPRHLIQERQVLQRNRLPTKRSLTGLWPESAKLLH